MTSHGFLGLRVGSEIEDDTLREVAQEIAKMDDVIWVYIVEHRKSSSGRKHNIMVEFDPRPERTYKDLLGEIKGQFGELVHEPIDVWIKLGDPFQGPKEAHR